MNSQQHIISAGMKIDDVIAKVMGDKFALLEISEDVPLRLNCYLLWHVHMLMN